MMLLDTNVVSEPTRRRPDARVLSWLDRHRDQGLFISVITLGEVRKGIASLPAGERKEGLDAWLLRLRSTFASRTLPVDETVADVWGAMLAAAAGRAVALHPVDALIGATARVHGLSIVTRNTTDFAPCGVPVVNPWSD